MRVGCVSARLGFSFIMARFMVIFAALLLITGEYNVFVDLSK